MKWLSASLVSIGITLTLTTPVSASLAVIEPDGEITLNVLGDETNSLTIPQSESLKVTKSLSYAAGTNSQVSLQRDGDGVYLKVANENGEETLDVGNYSDEVVEIEERPETETMSIRVENGKFVIKQSNVSASTDYEITIDSEKARLLLDAPGGQQFLSISPREAVQTVLRAKTLSNINYDTVVIEEDGDHKLTYKVAGDKLLNFFDVYYYPVPITVQLSALTGEITYVDQPEWFKYLGFLFQ